MAPASSPDRASGPWSLLWVVGGAAAVWIPLLLADSLPRASTALAPASLVVPAVGPTTTPLSKPGPLLASLAQAPAPLGARPKPLVHSNPPVASTISPLPPQRVETAKLEALTRPAFQQATGATPAPAPAGQHHLPGSLLLGGPLTLASLQEKPMVPAARIEQALRARSADRLLAVPPHWRPTMEALIQGQQVVLPTEVVYLPVPQLKNREDYPMAVRSDGVAVPPLVLSELSRQVLERWIKRQKPIPQGSVRPVMVVLEPLTAEPEQSEKSVEN